MPGRTKHDLAAPLLAAKGMAGRVVSRIGFNLADYTPENSAVVKASHQNLSKQLGSHFQCGSIKE
jgi:hypothetical protein